MSNLKVRIINPLQNLNRVVQLLLQLNPEKDKKHLAHVLNHMYSFTNYVCFGLYENDNLIGIASGWTTVRVYSGKQLELDNVVIDEKLQSKGYGKVFFDKISTWALDHDHESLNLNTYVSNPRSHKFYFNHGYKILGFHFHKLIS